MNKESVRKFGDLPSISISRSKIRIPHTLKTTFDSSKLIPLFWKEILPGETVSMDLSQIVRMATPIAPVMDDCFEDIHAFYVPNRILWDHWEQFFGSTDDTTQYYYNTTEYNVPQINLGGSIRTGVDVLDYLGLPTEISFSGTDNIRVSALPVRAYIKIWNDFYRDQNTEAPVLLDTSDNVTSFGGSAQETGDYHMDILHGIGLLPVSKVHDLFTSCFLTPQRGPETRIPVSGIPFTYTAKNKSTGVTWNSEVRDYSTGGSAVWSDNNTMLYSNNVLFNHSGTVQGLGATYQLGFSDANLGTINQLRMAFQIQRYYETLSMTGNRYCEIIRGVYETNIGDGRLQRAEYLGGKRVNITMSQIVQTSESNTTPLGNTGAYSVTRDSSHLFTKSFSDFGILMVLASVRTKHTYSQGIDKAWTKKSRLDFYTPQLANIGYQPVNKSEIYFVPQSANSVFGYQEAWYEYRYKPNRVTSFFRPYVAENLGVWTYADHFTAPPTLNSDFMHEVKTNIDRTLAVTSDIANQFIGDYFFNYVDVLPMPLYSIPGLADHH